MCSALSCGKHPVGMTRSVKKKNRVRWWSHPLFGTLNGRPPPSPSGKSAAKLRSLDELGKGKEWRVDRSAAPCSGSTVRMLRRLRAALRSPKNSERSRRPSRPTTTRPRRGRGGSIRRPARLARDRADPAPAAVSRPLRCLTCGRLSPSSCCRSTLGPAGRPGRRRRARCRSTRHSGGGCRSETGAAFAAARPRGSASITSCRSRRAVRRTGAEPRPRVRPLQPSSPLEAAAIRLAGRAACHLRQPPEHSPYSAQWQGSRRDGLGRGSPTSVRGSGGSLASGGSPSSASPCCLSSTSSGSSYSAGGPRRSRSVRTSCSKG